jgi:hypothetical protein
LWKHCRRINENSLTLDELIKIAPYNEHNFRYYEAFLDSNDRESLNDDNWDEYVKIRSEKDEIKKVIKQKQKAKQAGKFKI